ncbi:acyltransferase [Halobellus litoreus]|uniref:DapH/DapD/GlmU-related protein n=1 Tax=Halobellus litoreus TaxID=755310 RepID=A0ABD6DX77_9EURY
MSDFTIVENTAVGSGTEIGHFTVIHDSVIGENCRIWRFDNLYGVSIGDDCMIGSLVEIQEDVQIGDRCRVQSHSFVCSFVTLADDVFVSHGAKFVNDLYPPSGNKDEWEETRVQNGAAIGTNATILPVEIGENALVGAGAVVTEDVPENAIVAGNPAEIVGYVDEE